MTSMRAGVLPGLLLLGLALRLVFVPYDGMMDVDVYRDWGTSTLAQGVVPAFQGIYFPVQYQLFALVAALATTLGGGFILWLKVVSLAFECATMAVLWRRAGAPDRRLALCLMYWVNPWFLALASLGYCDFQLGFFVVCFLALFEADATPRRALLAGVPLAFAFLMKPQAMVVVLMTGFVGAFLALRDRRALRTLALAVVPAVVLFVGYSAWFALHGERITTLARAYLRTSAVMPSLTANMLNVWHPVCVILHPGEPVWATRDDVALWPGITYRRAALAMTLLLKFSYAGTEVFRRKGGYALVPAITFATLVVPLVMSGAHENHLYLATMGLVLMAASGGLSRRGHVLFAVFSVLCTLNLVGHYGLGRSPLSELAPVAALMQLWTNPTAPLVASVAMIATFVVAVATFFGEAAGEAVPLGSRWSRVPLFVVVVFLVAVYATAARASLG